MKNEHQLFSSLSWFGWGLPSKVHVLEDQSSCGSVEAAEMLRGGIKQKTVMTLGVLFSEEIKVLLIEPWFLLMKMKQYKERKLGSFPTLFFYLVMESQALTASPIILPSAMLYGSQKTLTRVSVCQTIFLDLKNHELNKPNNLQMI